MIVLEDFHMAPLNTQGDLAFVAYDCIIKRRGILGVVVPHGVLFRGASEKEIRKGIWRMICWRQ